MSLSPAGSRILCRFFPGSIINVLAAKWKFSNSMIPRAFKGPLSLPFTHSFIHSFISGTIYIINEASALSLRYSLSCCSDCSRVGRWEPLQAVPRFLASPCFSQDTPCSPGAHPALTLGSAISPKSPAPFSGGWTFEAMIGALSVLAATGTSFFQALLAVRAEKCTHAHTHTHARPFLCKKRASTPIPRCSPAPQNRLRPASSPYMKLPSPAVRSPAPHPQALPGGSAAPRVTLRPHGRLLPWPQLTGMGMRKAERSEQQGGNVLLFRGCWTKSPQTGWLRTTGLYSLTFRSQKSEMKASVGFVPAGASEGDSGSYLFRLPVAACSLWCSPACGRVSPVLPSSSRSLLCVPMCKISLFL